ncbi:MAG: hypothetical protein ABL888_22765, partial [Pirellulaceae bacterium]
MHQQPFVRDVVGVLVGDFEVEDGLGTGAGGDGGEAEVLAVEGHDRFADLQVASVHEVLPRDAPERVGRRRADRSRTPRKPQIDY